MLLFLFFCSSLGLKLMVNGNQEETVTRLPDIIQRVQDITDLIIISGNLSSSDLESFNTNFPKIKKLVIKEEVELEEDIIFTFRGSLSLMDIEFPQVTNIPESCFRDCTNLKKVDFKDCTSIQSSAFANCWKLEIVSIPKLEKMAKDSTSNDGKHFFNCSNLINITFSSLKTIGGLESFSMCTSLETVEIDLKANAIPAKCFFGCINLLKIDTFARTIEEYAFKDCKSLGSVNMEITTMGKGVFENCESLVKVSHEFVAAINEDCFKNCVSLVECIIPGASIVGKQAFMNCISLKNIDLSNCMTLETFCFYNCSSIEILIADRVTRVLDEKHFAECTNLKEISLKKLEYISSDNDNVFYNCVLLNKFYFPSSPPLTFNRNVFINRNSRLGPEIILPNTLDYYTYDDSLSVSTDTAGDTYWCGIEFPQIALYVTVNTKNAKGNSLASAVTKSNTAKDSIKQLRITDGVLRPIDFISSTSTSADMKSNYPYLETFIVEDTVQIMDDAIPASAFSGHQAIKEITIPNAKISSQYTFNSCVYLTRMALPDVVQCEIKTFYDCINLVTIDLPSLVDVPYECFNGLNKLQTANIPNAEILGDRAFFKAFELVYVDLSKVTSIGNNTFFQCHKLVNISMPELMTLDFNTFTECTGLHTVSLARVTSIKASCFNSSGIVYIEAPLVTSIEEYAFLNCPNLKEISFAQLKSIGACAFINCTSLKSADVPLVKEIQHNCFENNIALETFTAALESIESCAFLNCIELESLATEKVTYLGDNSFENCSSMASLTFDKLLEINSENIFKNCINLTQISMKALENITATENGIFEGCTKLAKISLGPKPPDMNFNIFKDHSHIELILSNKDDYINYDQALTCNDKKGDCMWCGILLSQISQHVNFNSNKNQTASSLKYAIEYAGIQLSDVININITGYFNGKDWETIAQMTSLKTLELNSSGYTIIDENALKNHPSVENVTIHSAKKAKKRTFYNCQNLKYLEIDDVDILSDTEHFANDINLISVSMKSLKQISKNSNSFDNCNKLVELRLGSVPPSILDKGIFPTNVNLILPHKEDYYTYDNSIDVAGDVKGDSYWNMIFLHQIARKINVNGKEMISGSSIIDSIINSPNLDSARVNTIAINTGLITERDFEGIAVKLPSLKQFEINPTVEVANQMLPSNGFRNHTGITTIIINQSITIGESCFEGCSKLKTFIMTSNGASKELKSTVNVEKRAFYGCSSLIEVKLDGVSILYDECFSFCSSIPNISFPSVIEIKRSAFRLCSGLKTINLESLTTLTGNEIFRDCISLSCITMPNLTTVDPLMPDIFMKCSRLSCINLGSVPPRAFHQLTFKFTQSQKTMKLNLPNIEDYVTYDNSLDVSGDEVNDKMWCGISLCNAMDCSDGQNGNNQNLSIIIGSSVGAVVVVVIIVVILIFVIKNRSEELSSGDYSNDNSGIITFDENI